MHSISLTNSWNLTKLAKIHHQDVEKKRLDFGDLAIFCMNVDIDKLSLL